MSCSLIAQARNITWTWGAEWKSSSLQQRRHRPQFRRLDLQAVASPAGRIQAPAQRSSSSTAFRQQVEHLKIEAKQAFDGCGVSGVEGIGQGWSDSLGLNY